MSGLLAGVAWLKSNRPLAAAAAALSLLLALWAGWTIAVAVGERRQAGRAALAQARAQAQAAVEAARADAAVKAALAEDRQETALAMERQQRDLEAADDGQDDARPSAARRAYLCGVMRSQAGPGARLPAECRPQGPA